MQCRDNSDGRSHPGRDTDPILVLNGGSSSVKFALFSRDGDRPALRGAVERIGVEGTCMSFATDDAPRERLPMRGRSFDEVIGELVGWLTSRVDFDALLGVAHRVVHGGPRYVEAQAVTADMLEELRRISPFDPEHLPAEIALIEAIAARHPRVPQVACFDTAFHRHLPGVARRLSIPRRFENQGLRRYGFHGLSYAYLVEELASRHDGGLAGKKIVFAHLGNGSSMAAVQDGRSIDTSMGFSPTAGMPMSTRSGDIDPGVVRYLATVEGMSIEAIHAMLTSRSGLLGVSETSSDMRDLLAREATDPRAADAVEMYCYHARRWIASLAAALEGLDILVFSGGIGENAAEVRRRIALPLAFLGVTLNDAANEGHGPLISEPAGRVAVHVIATNEELTMLRQTRRVLGHGEETTPTA